MKSGQVDDDWNSGEHKGIPFGSVVTIVVRKGNPKTSRPGTTCSSRASRSSPRTRSARARAKWNLLAPYADKSNGGKDPEAGLAYLKQLIGEHVKVQPKSGREATETFLQGTGDVLLSYENEALFAERNGEDVEHVTPDTTFKIENPVAVLNTASTRSRREAFVDFLYTPEGQKAWAEAGFRPVDQSVAQQFASDFPAPKKLYTIDDLGGWSKVNDSLFDPDTGSVAKIYDEATSRASHDTNGRSHSEAPRPAPHGGGRRAPSPAASGRSGSASPRCGSASSSCCRSRRCSRRRSRTGRPALWDAVDRAGRRCAALELTVRSRSSWR